MPGDQPFHQRSARVQRDPQRRIAAENLQKRQVTVVVGPLEDVSKLPIGWWLWRAKISRMWLGMIRHGAMLKGLDGSHSRLGAGGGCEQITSSATTPQPIQFTWIKSQWGEGGGRRGKGETESGPVPNRWIAPVLVLPPCAFRPPLPPSFRHNRNKRFLHAVIMPLLRRVKGGAEKKKAKGDCETASVRHVIPSFFPLPSP